MSRLIARVHAFLWDDCGEDLTEYGMLIFLIAILAMVAVGDVGVQVNTLWTDIVGEIAEVF
jgi:Flp pilus assembly pilin Flp